MRFRLLLLFVVTPLVEMVLLIRLGQWLGLWPTIALVLMTGVIGGTMARSQGLATWQRFQSTMSTGRVPTDEIVDGVIILISAVLLVTPGVLTDVAGFLGLLPASRTAIRRIVARRISLRAGVYGPSGSASGADEIRPGGGRDDESAWGGEARRHPGHENRTSVSSEGHP